MVAEKNSRYRSDEYASYAVPDAFWTGSEALNLTACLMF
jgi:hypothetical protein